MARSTSTEVKGEVLIAQAAAGDREAFGRLYEEHSVRVFRHAYFMTGDVNLAEDLTAQTFLKALEAIGRYEDRGVPFIAWLLRITVNLAINHRKALKNGIHAQLPEQLEDNDALGSPETSCTLKSEGERVWNKVKELPAEQRQVIVMRFMDDRPYTEVAAVLGKSIGAVRVIQFRALNNLRNLMRKDEQAELVPVRRLARAS
ncbi:MAG: RNA polymerase sigma factor [Chloroflexota bacterium]